MLDNLVAAFFAGSFCHSYIKNFQHVRWWTTERGEIIWDGQSNNPKMGIYIRNCQIDAMRDLIFTIIFLVLGVL